MHDIIDFNADISPLRLLRQRSGRRYGANFGYLINSWLQTIEQMLKKVLCVHR